jgi:hypothetical protein
VLVLPAGVGHLRIAPYPDANPVHAIPYPEACSTAKTTTPMELITSLLDKRREALIDRLQPRGHVLKEINDRYDSITKMAVEMDAAGIFKDVPYIFFHIDLFPRNLLADPEPKPGHPVLTGVLDWDFARFLPAFMAAEPPIWLWMWNEYAHSDSDTDSDSDSDECEAEYEAEVKLPESEKDQEIKTLFEQAAGPTYMRFAYSKVYWIARKLFAFTYQGMFNELEPTMEAWEKYKGEAGLAQSDESGDEEETEE